MYIAHIHYHKECVRTKHIVVVAAAVVGTDRTRQDGVDITYFHKMEKVNVGALRYIHSCLVLWIINFSFVRPALWRQFSSSCWWLHIIMVSVYIKVDL